MAIIQRKIQIDEKTMGPGFFIFFRNEDVVIPPSVGSASTSAAAATLEYDDIDLDNADISDIIAILTMSGLL